MMYHAGVEMIPPGLGEQAEGAFAPCFAGD